MLLSFHPCFETDRNILCAGRLPGPSDLEAICAARAVILPQGCGAELYRMARANCEHVFPNWDARFEYPGKCGQIRLFRKYGAAHPHTLLFESLDHFQQTRLEENGAMPLPLPFVLKYDWGGQGEGVFLIASAEELHTALKRVAAFESSGQKGFLIQQYIDCKHRSLRVVVIGELITSYFRVQEKADSFLSNLSTGAVIDPSIDPDLQLAGKAAVKELCQKSGINLAGFDLLFSEKAENQQPKPLFLEINYFFGRTGLGGSEKFYELLTDQIERWLDKLKSPP